jgi:hypothetical protein
MSQSRKDFNEVPININGTHMIVKGVSKYTTCSDVIKMVLKKVNIGRENGSSEAFGIFEYAHGTERLLSGKSRLLKVMRSWGRHDDCEFVFRNLNAAFVAQAQRRKYTNPKATDSTNEGCNLHENGGTTHKDRNVTGQSDITRLVRSGNTRVNINVNNVKYAVRKPLKTKSCNLDGLNEKVTKGGHEIHATPNSRVAREDSTEINRHEALASDIASQVARMNNRVAKEALLQKYFADYITYRSPGDKYRDFRFRERGDGAKSSDHVFPVKQGDGSEECVFRTPKARTLMSQLVFSDSEDSVDSGQKEEFSNFDVAFISDNNFWCSTPHVSPVRGEKWINANHDVIDIEHHDIPCVGRLVDYSLSDDSVLSHPSDISDISSANKSTVHDVSSMSEFVKAVFNEDRLLSEDDEMESFMKSKMYDDLSDEGLSSLGSDDDIEVIV